MFTKKSAKFIFITLLSTISLTGYFHVYPSSIFASNDSKTEKNTEVKEENQESTTNISNEYEKLLEEYKKFAVYIYKIGENEQPIKDDEKAVTSGEKPALGKLTQFLNEQSKNSPTLIEDKEQILLNYHEQFTKFIEQLDNFKQEINNLSDETKKQEILNKFKDSENKDLWLTSSDLETFKGYFLDGKLEQQEICDIQSNLDIQKEDECGNSGKGKFGNQTYDKLENILRNKTLEFGNSLSDIKPLIDTISVSDTNSDKNTNNNTNNANNNKTDSNPSSIDKNLIISSLALLIGIISSLLSLITLFTLLKLFNYQKESKQDLEKLKQLSGQRNKKINQLNEEIKRLKTQQNNPPPVQTFTRDYDDINTGYIPTQITSQPNLFKSTEKSGNNVIVMGGLLNKQPQPLRISGEELICLYNYVPQVLSKYATEVNLTNETYQGRTQGKIYLEIANNGYYWVILTEDEQDKYYWLLPNGNIKISLHRLKNFVKYLFSVEGEKPHKNSEFILEKPAKLLILSSGITWELIDKGELQVGRLSPTAKLLTELEKISNNDGKVPKNLEEFWQIIQQVNQIDSLIHQQNKSLELNFQNQQYKMQEMENQYAEIVKKLQSQINEQQGQISNLWTKFQRLKPLYKNINEKNLDNSNIKITPEEQSLINAYYNNTQYLMSHTYKVVPTKQTVENIYLNKANEIIFQSSNQSDYWVIQLQSGTYYLLPDLNLKINIHIKIIRMIFNLQNYIEHELKNFTLIKSAKVFSHNETEWKLIEKGILQF